MKYRKPCRMGEDDKGGQWTVPLAVDDARRWMMMMPVATVAQPA
jgi:hypothetical protein